MTRRLADLLRRASGALAELYQGDGAAGLTVTQLLALDALKQRKRLTRPDLIVIAGLDRATTFSMLDRLKDRGLVRYVKAEDGKGLGRRAMNVELTPRGLEVHNAADQRLAQAERTLKYRLRCVGAKRMMEGLADLSSAPGAR